jgi:hypothetical protein
MQAVSFSSSGRVKGEMVVVLPMLSSSRPLEMAIIGRASSINQPTITKFDAFPADDGRPHV